MMLQRVSCAFVFAGVPPSKMICFCCTARICLWGLQSTGEIATEGTNFIFLSCVLHDGKDLSCGFSVCIETFLWFMARSAKPAPTSTGWFLIWNQFGLHLWGVRLLGAASADYFQQIKHKLGSVILLRALGYCQCRQQ